MSDQSLDLFGEACGSVGPFELMVEGTGRSEPWQKTFFTPFAILGRDGNADLVIEHKLAKRRHVYIQMLEGRLFWVDLRFPGEEAKCGWLTPEEPLTLPPLTIHQTRPSQVTPLHDFQPLTDRPLESQELSPVTLQFLNGPPEPISWPMNRLLTLVGRSTACKIKLLDPAISSIHCSLLRARQGLWIIDLLGRGGVLVNSRAVRWSHLSDGDVFQVGPFVIRVQFERRATFALPELVPTPVPRRPMPPPVIWHPSEGAESGIPLSGNPAVQALPGPSADHLLPLFNQFAGMQQQMFEQFQQTILMMAQMFTSMQKEQMGLLRQELDQIRELTRELHNLQSRAGVQATPVFGPGTLASETVLAAEAAWPSSTTPASPVTSKESEKTRPAQPPVEETTAPPVEEPTPAEPEPAMAASSESSPEPPDPGELHAWLHGRIAQIQKERDSRLQRVLKQIFGR